jgi:hypothetical protein
MNETRFRFPTYSPERLWAARWHLFEFPEIRNVAYVDRDVIVVFHHGEPRITEWVERLSARGIDLEPTTSGKTAA